MHNHLKFCEHFSMFLKQGYSVDEVLQIMDSLGYKKEVQQILEALNNGEALDEALLNLNLKKEFKEYFIFFKNTFSVDEALRKALNVTMQRIEMKKRLKKSLTYPLVLLVFAIIFCVFVSIFLMPQLEMLFIDFEIEKSTFVEIMFFAFRFIPVLFLVLSSTLIILIAYAIYIVKKQKFRDIDRIIKYLKLFSFVVKKYYSLKFAQYFDELIENNYDLTSIVEILYHQIDDNDIKFIVYELYHSLTRGESLIDSMNSFPYFDNEFKMFFMLMDKNTREKSLKEYIDFSYLQIELMFSNFIKYLVPSIYIFVGGIVVLVYMTIILPMMNAISLI